MTPSETENLLWQLTTVEETEPSDSPSQEELAKYWSRDLSTERAEAVERLLASSPRARAELRDVAALPPLEAPAGPRKRWLEELGVGGAGEAERERAPVLRFPAWRQVLPLAAALVLAVGALFFVGGESEPLPEFTISLAKLSEYRSAAPTANGEGGAFYPESPVAISVEPWEAAQAGLEFGLYRKVGERFERIELGGEIEARIHRGAATFEASAAALVGAEPGDYTLYVVIAREGDLPTEVAIRGVADLGALLSGRGRRQAYTVPLTILPRPGESRLSPPGPE